MLSSSALRSLPGQAQMRASKHRRPKTCPLGRGVRGNVSWQLRRGPAVSLNFTPDYAQTDPSLPFPNQDAPGVVQLPPAKIWKIAHGHLTSKGPYGYAMLHRAEEEPEGHLSSKGLHVWWTTYSLVSSVTMMRIGRRFIPPTQLLLHMKLYKTVVNSVPTWMRQRGWTEEAVDEKLCFFQAHHLYFHICAAIRLAWNRPHHKASLKEIKNSCSQGIKRVFKSSFLTKRKKGFIMMRMGKAQGPDSFD